MSKAANGIATRNDGVYITTGTQGTEVGGEQCLIKSELTRRNLRIKPIATRVYTDVQCVCYEDLTQNLVGYTVKHMKYNASTGGYELTETETFEGQVGTYVTPAVKTYSGYVSPAQTGLILSSDASSNVVTYKYNLENITFKIIDATTGGGIDNTSIVIKFNGDDVAYTYAATGLYTISTPTLSSFTVYVNKPGYEEYNVSGVTLPTLVTSGVALTPIGKRTVYCNWDHSAIKDVDTHMTIYDENMSAVTSAEISYSTRGEYTVGTAFKISLDLDDTGANNGETVTIEILNQAEYNKYTFFYTLLDWSYTPSGSSSNPYMNNQGLTVTVGSQVITPPEGNTPGRWWRVFSMKAGVVTVTNQITTENSGYWQATKGLPNS